MKRVLIGLGAACVLAVCIVGIVLVVRAQTQAQAMQQFIAAGPANLAREEAAARQEGIPLSAAQLQKPLPPPSQNAAPLYVTLTKLLHDKPLGLPKYAEGMDAFHTYTPEQIAAVRRTLAARQDVMTLVHQAADRPRCVFVRDWSQGIALEFPEYQHQREAARLLRTESYLLARDGRYQEAVANQARGFRVADQAAADHTLISYLVGIASQASAFGGMQGILAQAGPNAAVDANIKKTVAAAYMRLSLRSAIVGDTGLGCASLAKVHQYEKYGIEVALKTGFPDDDAHQSRPLPTSQVSTAERERLHNLIDAWQADYLSEMLPLIRASDAPRVARSAVFAATYKPRNKEADSTAPLTDPMHWVPRLLVPNLSNIDQNDTRISAREAVTLAASAILTQKAEAGAYPDNLPPGFTDPFTDKPLGYRREGGGFVVYSAGPTGHFDGGKPGQKTPGQESLFRYPVIPVPPN
jgi:hypothetical protein